MANQVWQARKIVGGSARGQALVSTEPVCFLGGVDVKTGLFTERGHQLEGKNISNKILVFPNGKGSTGGSYLLYEASMNHVGPAAVVNLKADPVTVVGCIISKVPMVCVAEEEILTSIHTGDEVEVDATGGQVRLVKRQSESLR